MSPESFVEIPAGPFLLGVDYQQLPEPLRQADASRSLGLGAVLAGTPGHWVDLPAYRMLDRLVDNAAYQRFWSAPHPTDSARRLVDDAEVWTYVWDRFGLTSIRVPAADGGGGGLLEDYSGVTTAIDALVQSYSWEAQRIVLGHHVPPSESGFDDQSTALVRCFAWLRRGLAASLQLPDPCSPGQLKALTGLEADDLLGEVDRTLSACEQRLTAGARVPLLIVLRRMRAALAAGRPLLVSDLLRPLFWPDDIAKALREAGGLFKSRMPYGELPVIGVSLYEAAAFTAWASLELGVSVTLPSEAEYEKAFGWDWSATTLDPAHKRIYPWQGSSERDFNQWFSREGERLEQLQARAAGWRQLVEETACRVGPRPLYHGLGFGWQWTRERFNELERKYNRFANPALPRRQHEGRTIHAWRDHNDRLARYIAVRGAPDQLGGPGTTTRRFALSPLRGYSECSFRCVISEQGDL